MTRIGIPRALLYYQYYPMWKKFFNGLGAELVVSPLSTQATVLAGSSRVVTDTCLPVKVFIGHVLSLVGKCDYLFIPSIRSIKRRVYNCSKFLGLPDMTRAVVPESPPILDIDVDVNKGKAKLLAAIYRLAQRLSRNPLKVRQVSLDALSEHLYYQQLMAREGLTPPQAIERLDSGVSTETSGPSGQTVIALIGHPYLLHDDYVNYRLIHRLQRAGARIFTPEMLTREQLEAGIVGLVGSALWTYEDEVVGAGEHYLQGGQVDGVIGLMAFGCGPDSLMMDMVRRRAARLKSTPFMCLTLEEHTAEAGIITRLEAFLDMVKLRKTNERKYAHSYTPYG